MTRPACEREDMGRRRGPMRVKAVTQLVRRDAPCPPDEVCQWSGLAQRIADDRATLCRMAADRSFERRPVTLSSGRQSGYYVDGKQVTLWPTGALLLARIILKAVQDQPVDAIGGLTIGADPIVGGVVVLSALEGRPIPGFLVRKEPKRHGKMALIEGELKSEWRVLIVDDVITTGASILKTIHAVEEYGVRVVGVFALTDREEGGRAMLESRGYPTFAVCTASELAEAKQCRQP